MYEQDQLRLPESLEEAIALAKQVPSDGELHLKKAQMWEQVVSRRQTSRLRGRLVLIGVAVMVVAALFGTIDSTVKKTASPLQPVQLANDERDSMYVDKEKGYQLKKIGQTAVLMQRDGVTMTALFQFGENDQVQLMAQNPPHFAIMVKKPDLSEVLYMVDADQKSTLKLISKGAFMFALSDDQKAQPQVLGMIDPTTYHQQFYTFDWDKGTGKLLYESKGDVFDRLDKVDDLVVLGSQHQILLKDGLDGAWKTVASSGDKSDLQYLYGSQNSLFYIKGSAFQPAPNNGHEGTARVMRYDVKSGVSSMLLPNREGDQTMLSYRWDDIITADQKVGYVIGNFLPKQLVSHVDTQARANQPGTMEVWFAVPGEEPTKLFEYETTWSMQHIQINHEPDGKHIRFMNVQHMNDKTQPADWIWDPTTGDIKPEFQQNG